MTGLSLVPPLTIFVDEAGSVEFRPPSEGGRKRAYAVFAVAVPTIDFEDFHNMLPRDSDGRYLKSSDRNFHPGLALPFVHRLIASTAEVGGMVVDPGCPENIELALKMVESENEGRKKAREKEETEEGKRLHPDIKPHDLFYFAFFYPAVLKCLEAYYAHNGGPPTYVDIVVDTMNVDEFQRKRFVQTIRRACHEHGITVRGYTWRTEQEEPLLLLPDLIGGILCRHDRYGDVPAATALWDAERAGRFKFQNKAPSEQVARAEGEAE